MHSFRLYLINAIHILTFPYRFVNIYFCVFSDFFQSCRFFIDKSFKAQKPPDAKRFAENRIAPPPRPRRQPQRVSAEPRARQADTRQSLAARRQTALQTLCNRFSPRPRRAFAFRPASDQPPVLPTRRRLRMARQTAHAENKKPEQSDADNIRRETQAPIPLSPSAYLNPKCRYQHGRSTAEKHYSDTIQDIVFSYRARYRKSNRGSQSPAKGHSTAETLRLCLQRHGRSKAEKEPTARTSRYLLISKKTCGQ